MNEPSVGQVRLPEEYEALLHLWRNAGPGIGVSKSDELTHLMQKYNAAPELFLVARAGSEVVGSVIGGFDGRRGLVYHLAVATPYRNSGLGSRLLAMVEERLKQAGCTKAYLLVKRGNPALEAYYEKRDWQDMEDTKLFGKVLQ